MSDLSDRIAGLPPEKLAKLLEKLEQREAGGSNPLRIAGIPRRDDEGPAPLSFSQERLWFLDGLEGGSAAYNVPAALRLRGPLRVAALAAAFSEVVRRHEVLRTTYRSTEGHPVQEVSPPAPVPLHHVDLESLPAARAESEIVRLARAERARPFDLAFGPVLRVSLLRLAQAHHALLFTMHHIASDGWSVEVLTREVTELYRAFSSGRSSPLEPLPIQYADYSVWQRRRLEGSGLDAEIDFWRDALAGTDPLLELPLDRPRPRTQSFRGGGAGFELTPSQAADLDAFCAQHRATPFMVVLAAFQALLGRYSQQTRFNVGTPVAGRSQVETEDLIGFFVNTLVLGADLRGDPDFVALVERARDTVLAAQAKQDVPFERLVEELQPRRTLAHEPFFQCVLIFENAGDGEAAASAAGLSLEAIPVATTATHFDLTLTVIDHPDGYAGRVHYRSDLFDHASIERFAGHFRHLLAAALESPRMPFRRLPVMPPEERQHVVVEWGRRRPVPSAPGIHDLFAVRAAETPSAPAVIYELEELTYGELEAASNRLAHHLRRQGVGAEDRVGVVMERSLELVVALLGILKAGAAYLPLDPAAPAERRAYMLADSGAAAVVTHRGLAADLEIGETPGDGLRRVDFDVDAAALAAEPDTPPEVGIAEDALAYVIYTSGSTGRPKGVQVCHGHVIRLLRATEEWFGFGRDDVWTLFHSYAFDFSVWELWGALAYGGSVVVVPYLVSRSPEDFYRLLVQEEVTVLNQTPSAFRQLIAAEDGLAAAGEPTSDLALRWVVFGGEALEPASLRSWVERHGTQAPRLVNMYGITETTVHVTYRPLTEEDVFGGAASVVGVPIPDLSVHALDPWLRPVPIGVAGELCIGGAGVSRGYLGRPALTSQRFVPDPWSRTGERLYRSGDLGRRRPDGDLEYLGRIDTQVQLRGFRVELGEIESRLAEHPAVREAAVVVRGDDADDQRLVAYVVVREATVGGAELRAHLMRSLPEYMVPGAWVTLDALPLTVNGKVDRDALPDPGGEATAADEYVAPRNHLEQRLAALWIDLLGVERVGLGDDFFALGGHSLLVTRLITRLRDELEMELPLRQVFEHPTLGELAAVIENALESSSMAPAPEPVRPRPADAPVELSFAQRRFWFIQHLEPDNPAYNIFTAVRLTGSLEPALLRAALADVVSRHEVLRTSLGEDEGELVAQVVSVRPELPLHDLAALPPQGRDRELERLLRQEARSPFDLAVVPHVRMRLVALEPGVHAALVCLHHVAADGWSMGIFIRELAAAYRAHRDGESISLPDLEVQYADYAAWQNRRFSGDGLQRELEWWRSRLDGIERVLHLPLDRPRPQAQTYLGDRVSSPLLPVTQRLRERAQAAGATPFMVLLAAYQVLLARLSGQAAFAVGTPVAGRERGEVEGLIGCFVNTLALPARLAAGESFAARVDAVRGQQLDLLQHQELPFELLVDDLQPERSLSHSPLFQAMFVFQNRPEEVVHLPGLRLEALPGGGGTVHFDLTLGVAEGREHMGLSLEYASDLFDRTTVARWAEQLSALLAAALEDPGRRVSELPLLTPAQYQQVVVEWNDTAGKPPMPAADQTLHGQVWHSAERRPDAEALAWRGTDRHTWTFAELTGRALELAGELQGLGAGVDRPVALYAERTPEMAVGTLGILACGAPYLPIDPSYPAARVEAMLRDAGVEVVVVGDGLSLDVAEALPSGVCVLELDRTGAVVAGGRGAAPLVEPVRVPASALAYVIYTSGSTGTPKGVALSHAAAATFVRNAVESFGLGAGDRFLQFASPGFDVVVEELFPTWVSGACLVLPGVDLLGSYERFEDILSDEGITAVELPAAFWQEWAHELDERGSAPPPSLRRVLLGCDQPSLEHLESWRRHDVDLFYVFGLTETAVTSSVHAVDPDVPPLRELPIGRPLADVGYYVLDPHGAPVPRGVVGELYIAGRGLARGYVGRPRQTAERFLPDRFSRRPGARLYRTGDRARLRAGGEPEFLGRLDQQVKVRGFRVELGEIGHALELQPEVRHAVAAVLRASSGVDMVAAWVVPEDDVAEQGEEMLERELRDRLADILPQYMVPARITLLEHLPLTANGKVDRDALPEPELRSGGPRILPETPLECRLVDIWQEVLGVEDVGLEDDFFRLGGHSLLATRLMSRVRRAFSVEVPLRALFEEPTAGGLARTVERIRREAGIDVGAPVPLVAVGQQRDLPLSFAQQQLWFLDRFNPGGAVYNVADGMRLEGRLNTAALTAAFAEIVRRHEVLRTTFHEVDGTPLQTVQPWGRPAFPLVDLSALAEARRESVVRQLMQRAGVLPFDLSADPMARAVLYRLGAESHVASLTVHHIATDEWSMGILTRELAALYTAYATGEPSPLEELPLQYADFALWQRRHLAEDVMRDHLAWWRQHLEGLPPLLGLPVDHPRPAVATFRGARRRGRLSGAETAGLRDLARNHGATPYMVVMAVLQVLLARLSGQSRFAVGTPVAGREHLELEGLIGFFINTLALRGDVAGNPRFDELLSRVRETLLGGHEHQAVPFERVVEELQPERSLSRSPIFQVMLNLEEAQGRSLDLPGLDVAPVGVAGGDVAADLQISVVLSDQGGALDFHYADELFDATTIQRWVELFTGLLAAVSESPDRQVSEVPMLTPAQRQQVSLEWNDTQRCRHETGLDATLHGLVWRAAERWPDAEALSWRDGETLRTWTFTELTTRALELAGELRAAGCGLDSPVALYAERTPEMAVGTLGILAAGAAYLPLDPGYPPARVAAMIRHAGASLTVCGEGLAATLTDAVSAEPARPVVMQLDRSGRVAVGSRGAPALAQPVVVPESALAYVIYTSGSSGAPKGVALSHGAATTFVTAAMEHYGLGTGDRFLQFASPGFDVVVEELFPTWASAACLVMPGDDLLGSYERFEHILERESITGVELPAAFWHEWVRELEARDASPPPSLRLLLLGCEKPLPELLEAWRRYGVPLIYVFGLTETAVTSSLHSLDPGVRVDRDPHIGRPLDNATHYVLDPHGEPAPTSVVGELYIGGAGLARGYVGRPRLTAERFLPDGFASSPGARLYRTGDRARHRASGEMEFLGRLDHQVKVRGFRVELEEVEHALAADPSVGQVAVDVRTTDQGAESLIAYVVSGIHLLTDEEFGFGKPNDVELWPSQGDYHVYDEVLYSAMTLDETRNASYALAMERLVPGQVVIDVGTGADAVLSRMCVEAGARHVYAIEVLEESYHAAIQTVRDFGMEDKITVLLGDIRTIETPEKAAVCVSEQIGTIGGSEGGVVLLNHAWRLMTDDGVQIPTRCTTPIAAVRLPDELHARPAFTEVSGYYADCVLETRDQPFDFRLCLRNFPKSHVISTHGIFEDLDFSGPIPEEYDSEIELVITEDSRIDGFIAWVQVFPLEGEVVDVMEYQGSCWSPAFFPVFYPGVEVSKGDVLRGVCSTTLAEDGMKTDYRIAGILERQHGEDVEFDFFSPFYETRHLHHPFYSKMFAEGGLQRVQSSTEQYLSERLRSRVAESLPAYMVPSQVVFLPALPLTANGKVDRGALPEPGQSGSTVGTPPRTEVERKMVGIWENVLSVSPISMEDNFFRLGGHSLVATRLISRVRQAFGVELPLRRLFEEPTVAAVCEALAEHMPGAMMVSPPLVAVPRDGDLPLSFAQQRMWFIHQLDPGSAAYNVAEAVRADQQLDVGALAAALSEIVRRHEVLRTVFVAADDEPRQRVLPPAPFALPRVDLSGLSSARRDAVARRLIRSEAARPFDLGSDRQLRVGVVHLAANSHVILLTLHHAVTDEWSMGVLVRELAVLYDAARQQLPSPLPELPVQYADYAVWQRSWLKGEVLEREVEWWRHQLAGIETELDLPTDRPRRIATGHRAGSHSVWLSSEQADALRRLAAGHRATPFMVYLAIFQILLARLSGQRSLTVGTPVACRGALETEGLIGLFLNTLVLRGALRGDPTFATFLGACRATVVDAQTHQELPFERLVDELDVGRTGRSPLFQVMLNLDEGADRAAARESGLELAAMAAGSGEAQFELTLTVQDGEAPELWFEYAADLFDATTVRRWADHFTALLVAALEAPSQAVFDLPMLTAAQRQQVVLEWNDTGRAEASAGLHELVWSAAESRPLAAALSWHDGESPHRWTFSELTARALELAGELRAAGTRLDTPVALYAESTPELAVGALGILAAGASFLSLDPDHPPARIAAVLADAGVSQVVCGDGLAERLRQVVGGESALDATSLPGLLSLDRAGRVADGGRGVGPLEAPVVVPASALASLVYVSESSGAPTGVALSHGAVTALVSAAVDGYGLGPEDRFLQSAPPGVDALVEELFVTWASGACLVLAGELRVSRRSFEEILQREEITGARLPAGLWDDWTRALDEGRRTPPASLRLLLVGDEMPSAEQLEAWRLHGVSLLRTFGATEAAATSALRPLDPSQPTPHLTSVGRVLAHADHHVLDHRGEPVPPGAVGELWIGGESLARGYVGRAARTAESFVPDPFAAGPGARSYRSGVRARHLADGEVDLLGRLDRQVEVGGFRVELGEVEHALTAEPGVLRAVVELREATPGADALVAYVVTRGAGWDDVTELGDSLRRRVAESLPEHMVPTHVVRLDELPLTAAGEIDLTALPAPGLEDRLPQPARNAAEHKVLAIWEEVLGVEGFGVEDEFFALGGHSLLATRMMSRLRRSFGVEVPLRLLFDEPTVAALARAVTELGGDAASGIPVPPLVPIPRQGPSPLSFSQQRLWFIHRLDPVSVAYNVFESVRVDGDVDVAALAASFDEIVRRHEVLRTRFAEIDGEPVQVVEPASHRQLPVHDLSTLPPGRRADELARLTREEASTPFDLSAGRLLRVRLVRLEAMGLAVLLSIHHVASDEWSMKLLLGELRALYGAYAGGGRPATLPVLPVQYADYAEWQRSWLTGEVLRSELAWWKEELAGLPARLELPTDHPRPAATARGGLCTLRISAAASKSLRRLARVRHATPYMVWLAAFQALLARHSGQDDLAVGSPVAGRDRLEVEELIGVFINTLVLRGDLSGRPTFLELVDRTRERVLGAHGHQALPFELLVDELEPDRSLEHSPLFQVLFNFEDRRREDAGDEADVLLRLSPLDHGEPVATFDLTLTVAEPGQGPYTATLSYAADLFDPTTIERLAQRLVRLLEGAVAEPETAVAALPVLSASERRQVLVEAPDGGELAVPTGSLVDRVREVASRLPSSPAVIAGTATGEKREELTFAELVAHADGLAGELAGQGIGRGCRVAVWADRSVASYVGLLGILASGAAFVPLDPTWPEARLQWLVRDSRARALVLASGATASLTAEVPPVSVDLEAAPRAGARLPVPTADDVAYVLYTSGSTGAPRGVVVSHGNVLHLADALAATVHAGGDEPRRRVAMNGPLSFDTSIKQLVQWARGHVLLPVPESLRRAPAKLAAWVIEQGIDVLDLTPSLLRLLVEIDWPTKAPAGMRVLVGGEAVDPALWRAAAASPAEFWNLYGPTENTVNTTCRKIEGAEPSLGSPLPGRPVFVLGRDLEPVPPGAIGELCLAGGGVTRGYLGRAAWTAERFLPHPYGEPGERLYRSGDLGRLRGDGDLVYLGRADQQVKVRGIRIEPGEVEAALTSQPGVTAAAVLWRDTPSGPALVAFYVPVDDVSGAPESLIRALAELLPEPARPSYWVPLEALPLTANGKLDRRVLEAVELPSPTASQGGAPRTATEALLASIWADLLGAATEERAPLGRDSDFFALGGHSLLAIRVVSRVREMLGVELPVRALFEAPSLGDLARRVDALQRGSAATAAPPVTPVPRRGELPLSFAQQRLWFLHRLEPEGTAYNMPYALRLEGKLDAGALAAACSFVVARHEVLRTTYGEVDGAAVQRVGPPRPVRLPTLDLEALPTARAAAESRRLAEREAVRPFDLTGGPLLRLSLLRRGRREHQLLATLHHIAFDGWSMALLVSEVVAAYRDAVGGHPVNLPALPVQYADYAVWQRRWLAGAEMNRQAAWWRDELASLPPLLELPTDRPRPASPSHRGGFRPFALSAADSAAVHRLARTVGATPFMILLAAFASMLRRWSGQDEFAIGTPAAGRGRRELEGLIGFFVNTLVLRQRPAASFGELVATVRETALDAFAHQDLPFEKLVELMEPERSLAHTPLFQVLFVLQNAPPADVEVTAANGDGEALRLGRRDPAATGAGVEPFDLTLDLTEEGDRFVGGLSYAAELFDAATAERMLRGLERLLVSALAKPDADLNALPVWSAEEEAQVLGEWAGQAVQRPAGATTLAGLFAGRAAAEPQAEALVWSDDQGTHRWTYGDLAGRVAELAGQLRRRGVGPEVRVAVCLPREGELVVAMLAVLAAGGAYVPLDPGYPAARLRFMLTDSGARFVLTDSTLKELVAGAGAKVLSGRTWWRPTVPEAPTSSPLPGALAYVIYTSGSTGRPKGVAITHRSSVELARWAMEAFDDAEAASVLASTSVSFDLSVFELFATLARGGRVVLAENALALPGAAAAPGGVTLVNTVPSAMREVLDTGGLPASVRVVALAGEALPPALAADLYAAGAERVVNLYGPSEDTTYSTRWEVPRSGGPMRIGRPVENTRAFVVDRHLRPLPAGVPGELLLGEALLGGGGLARGYLGRPALTAERWLPDPFGDEPGGRLYRTGDRARWVDDGGLDYLGRFDHQIKLRGFRIELGEVEAVLAEADGVAEAAVVVSGDTLVAFVVSAADGPGAAPEAVRAAVAGRLPEHMVPRDVVVLEALPRTANGKLDRKALSRLEDQVARHRSAGSLPPRDALEHALVRLWEATLEVEGLGRDAGFFTLGGHSLLALRLVAALADELGVEAQVVEIFRHPTPARLAARLRERGAALSTPSLLVPLAAAGAAPDSTVDPVPWFLVHPAGGSAFAYHDLVARAPAELPLWGVQSVALSGGEVDDDADVETMAERYLAALRRRRPAGPYRLAGWSLGGVVAFEVARRLRRDGESVRLVLLDPSPVAADGGTSAPAVAGDVPPPLETLAELARHLGADDDDLEALWRSLPPAAAPIPAPVVPDAAVADTLMLDEDAWDRLLVTAVERGLWPAGLSAAELERRHHLFRRHLHALAAYRPAPLTGDELDATDLLVRAAEGAAEGAASWRWLYGDALRVESVAGTHHSFLRGDRADAVAALIFNPGNR